MDISGIVQRKLGNYFERDIPESVIRRLGLGLVLIIVTNLVSFTSGTLQTGLLTILLLLTPILILFDYREMWRGADEEEFGVFRVLAESDYQSIIAVTFTSHSVISYGFSNWVNILFSWGIAFPIGFLIYPFILSNVLSATWNYAVSRNPIALGYKENINGVGNIYYDKKWVDFGPMLYSFTDEVDLEKYSLIRRPVNAKTDFTFLTRIPPNLQEENHRNEVTQEVISLAPKCHFCHRISKDKFINGIVRKQVYPYIYKCESKPICQDCVMESVMEVSESESIPELTKSDLVANEI